MAENEDQDARTEPATPRRREQAREMGQVAYSADLITGLLLIVGVTAIAASASYIGGGLLSSVRLDLYGANLRELTPLMTQSLMIDLALRGLETIAPLLVILFITAIAGGLIQVGFAPNLDLLSFKFERLNPFDISKIISVDKLLKGMIAILKVVVVAAFAWWAVRSQFPAIGRLSEYRLDASIGEAWSYVLRLALALAGGLMFIGAIDYIIHRWRFERSIMMTRQELRDEQKREDGDPLVKARIRKLQREAAKKKMFHDVKKATVVVTNPTHLAIALRFERGTMPAPKVIAKGAGFVAQRIREIAQAEGIPVLERKSLAQSLYRSVKIDQEIPAGLFHAVAEVLAYVYRLRGLSK